MSSLMIQGCTSDAGKPTLVAGLCRVLQRAEHINRLADTLETHLDLEKLMELI